jgi:small-conductance mechanosensitive channel
MKKTIKKLENKLVQALTKACEEAKLHSRGFEWLTHTADYANFPASLHVRCIFDTDSSLLIAKKSGQDSDIIKLIHAALLKAGILLKHPKQHITFDTEQACDREHQGNWKKRINNTH